MDNINNLYVPVRERIFALLAFKSISQKDFAQAIDVIPQTVTDWKKGKSFSFAKMLATIAEVLGTTEEWLLTGEERSDLSQTARDALTEQLAQSVREQLSEEKKPIPADGDGLIMESAIRLHNWFHSLPLEKRKALLELGGGPEDLAE